MNLIETSTAERVLALARKSRLNQLALINMLRVKDERIAHLEYLLKLRDGCPCCEPEYLLAQKEGRA